MKKRWMALALTVPLVLGACAKDEEKSEAPKTQQEEKKGVTASELKNVVLSHKTAIDQNKLSITVSLANQNDSDVTVGFEKGSMLDVVIRNQNGELFDKITLNPAKSNVLKLAKGESYTHEYSGDLAQKYGTYSVTVIAHLKDKEGNVEEKTEKFDVKYAQEVKEVANTSTTEFQPSKKQTLVYQNNDGSGTEISEEYLYFNDGYAQAYNSMIGGNVVYYTDNTGYYRVYTDTGSKKENIIDKITPKKEMLIKLPAKKGDSWKNENISYVIEEENATIKTAFGTLNNVVVITADMGQKVRFYYTPDYGMVKTEAMTSSGSYQSLYELKSVK